MYQNILNNLPDKANNKVSGTDKDDSLKVEKEPLNNMNANA